MEKLSTVVDLVNIPESWAKQVAEALRSTHDVAKHARKEQIGGYREKLHAIESSEDSLYSDFKAGILSEEKYKRDLAKVRETRAGLVDLLERNHDEIDDAYLVTVESIFELASAAKRLLNEQKMDERMQFLEKFISNPRLNGLTIEFDLRSPFDVIAQMSLEKKWRSLWDSNPRYLREREVS